MRTFAVALLLAPLLFAVPVAAAPPSLSFEFGGTGSGGGYTATVSGMATIQPADRTLSVAGTITLEQDGTLLVEQSFLQTISWPRGASAASFTLTPIEGVTITVTIAPGQPAEVDVQVNLP